MNEILKKLIDNNYEAYIVGGYVRDILLGKTPTDIDIATNCSIEDIIKLFGKTGTIYKNYFSYHIEDIYNINITTFRKELKYENNKPTKIIRVNDLYTDLMRRDFTINTLALDINNNLIDLLNVKKDLDNKIIKCVNNTYDKFTEDKTRIVRAIRFMCVLDFELDSEIITFIKEKGKYISLLNNEYLKKELDIIFRSGNSNKFFNFIKKYNLKEYFGLNYNDIIFTDDYHSIWAQLDNNFNFNKEDKYIINSIKKIVKKGNIDYFDIYKYGEYITLNASKLINKYEETLELISSIPIKNILEIDITINDIKDNTNKNYNKILRKIEKRILEKKLNNNKCDIIEYIKGEENE